MTVAKEKSPEDFAKQFKLANLTSEVYGPKNPPKDFADASLLVPHETIRREMAGMQASLDKLATRLKDGSYKTWQAVYFCEWYIDIFEPFVHMHHDTEEELFFPWIAEKVEIPAKKYGKSHEEIVSLLIDMGNVCQVIVKKNGENCESEIKELKAKAERFIKDMSDHMKEEEEELPALERAHFTKEEEDVVVQKIVAKSPFSEVRDVFPAVLDAMNDFATQEYVDEFMLNLPGPLRYLMHNYFIPDYATSIKPKRDAPLYETKPALARKNCCGIFFCCACII